MEIREATAFDRDAVIALWETAGLTRPWNPPVADFDRALAGPSSTIMVAVEDHRLDGCVMAGHDGHRGWIYYLAVAPAARRSGAGRALVEHAGEWLRRSGIPKLQLMIRADNVEAGAFYDRLGFAVEPVTVRSLRLD